MAVVVVVITGAAVTTVGTVWTETPTVCQIRLYLKRILMT
jgi:hypothetical protein